MKLKHREARIVRTIVLMARDATIVLLHGIVGYLVARWLVDAYTDHTGMSAFWLAVLTGSLFIAMFYIATGLYMLMLRDLITSVWDYYWKRADHQEDES